MSLESKLVELHAKKEMLKNELLNSKNLNSKRTYKILKQLLKIQTKIKKLEKQVNGFVKPPVR